MRMFVDFVPISKKADEFSVQQDVEKFLRRVRLKAFFTTKRVILTPQTKILSKHFSFDPPEGQFAFLDFFIKNCHHDINKVKFNRYTKFSKLFPEEKSALKSPKNAKTQLLKRLTKAAHLSFGGPPSTKRKLYGNFLTPPCK